LDVEYERFRGRGVFGMPRVEFTAKHERANHRVEGILGKGVLSAWHISHADKSFGTASTIVVLLADARLEYQSGSQPAITEDNDWEIDDAVENGVSPFDALVID
jgi:hypothetical protein